MSIMSSNGSLMECNGALAADVFRADPGPCPTPAGCGACPATYTVTVSGLKVAGPNGVCTYAGIATATQQTPGSCTYVIGTDWASLTECVGATGGAHPLGGLLRISDGTDWEVVLLGEHDNLSAGADFSVSYKVPCATCPDADEYEFAGFNDATPGGQLALVDPGRVIVTADPSGDVSCFCESACPCSISSYQLTCDLTYQGDFSPVCGNATVPISTTMTKQLIPAAPELCFWDNRNEFGGVSVPDVLCLTSCAAPYFSLSANGIGIGVLALEFDPPEFDRYGVAGFYSLGDIAVDANGCPETQGLLSDTSSLLTQYFCPSHAQFTFGGWAMQLDNVQITQLSPSSGGGPGLGDMLAQGIQRATLGFVRECPRCRRWRRGLNWVGRYVGIG